MFENKGDSSSPDRSRSPGIPLSKKQDDGTSPGGSPRPLSKVRTNFVAVEKGGRIGLKRDDSGELSAPIRLPCPEAANNSRNNTCDQERDTTFLEDIVVMSTKGLSASATAIAASISPDERPIIVKDPAADLSETTKPLNSERDITLREGHVREICSLPYAKATKLRNQSEFCTNADVNTSLPATTAIDHNSGVNGASSVTLRGTVNESKATSRKAPENKAFRHESADAATAVGSSLRAKAIPASSGAPRRRELVGVRHQTSNNIEHKPKFSTPSSVMTPTASSASKSHDSQALRHTRPGTKSTISTSLQSRAKPGSNSASPNAVIKQRHASASSSRPSLGLPPSRSVPHSAATKRLGNVDESFLARMMRPTRSSASKFADKVSLMPHKSVSQPFPECKDSGPSGRKPARSVSSRCSTACKLSAIEVSGRSPPSINEDSHVAEVMECSEHTTNDINHEQHSTLADASGSTDQERASEGTPGIALVKDPVPGASTTNTVRDSSETEQLSGVKSCRQSCLLNIGSNSARKENTESQFSQTSELKLLEASILLAVPGSGRGDERDVALVNDEKSSSDEVSATQAKIENTEVEETGAAGS
ncbi:hypothetical protein E4U55_007800 [Claviceps digitariae]|nr:hypothetical protein E4U55_007800 [Claviceps digitariae]